MRDNISMQAAPTDMKTCPKCNSQIDEDMVLCPTCGEHLRVFSDNNRYDKHSALLVRFLIEFCVCKLNNIKDADLAAEFVFFAKTDSELSLVCLQENAPKNAAESNRLCKNIFMLIIGIHILALLERQLLYRYNSL